MSGALIQTNSLIKIHLKALESSISDTVIQVSNKQMQADAPSEIIYPILEQVGEFGFEMGDFVPTQSQSTITLNNRHGSFEFERRFSDLLDRYTVIGQKVSLYTITSSIDGDEAVTVLEWVGICSNVTINTESLTLNIAGQGINDYIMTNVVDTSESAFLYADENARGLNIPIVFGEDVEVSPQLIDTISSYAAIYAVQTTLGTQFKGGSPSRYFLPAPSTNQGYNFEEVISAASTTTALFDSTVGTLNTIYTGIDEVHVSRELNTTGANYVLTHAEVIFQAGTVGSQGAFSLEIWALAQNGYPLVMVGQSNISKSGYTWGVADTTVYFGFANPVPLNSSYGYIAYITQTGDNLRARFVDAASREESWTRKVTSGSDSSAAWTKHYFPQIPFACKFYGLKFESLDPTSGEVSSTGLGVQRLQVTQNIASAFATRGLYANLENLNFVVQCDGLKDDSSGNITGVANAVITNPLYAVKALSLEWNGSSWVDGQFDGSLYSSSHAALNADARFYRKLGGKTQGRMTRLQIIEEICRQFACKLTIQADSGDESLRTGLHAWGKESSISFFIDDDDLIFEDYQILGTETVVNHAEILYSELERRVSFQIAGNSLGENKSYDKRILYKNGSNVEVTEITAKSFAAFGERRNANPAYWFINDDVSASHLGQYLLRYYNLPHHYVSIRVPYYKYRSLELLDVVQVTSVKLPNFYGSSASAKQPSYAGIESSLAEGLHFRRSKSIKAMVESKSVIESDSQSPSTRLKLRLLTSDKDIN